MQSSKGTIVVYAIIGLAIIGVVTQLFSNTASFLTSIFTMLGFSIIVFALLYFFIFKKRSGGTSDESKKYKQAVKQSKAKYKQPQQDKSPSTPKSSK